MSGLDQLLRLQKWTLDEKRRQALDLEGLIEKFEIDIRQLDEEVIREIDASQESIELQRALPAYRKVMQERRERLEQSRRDLRVDARSGIGDGYDDEISGRGRGDCQLTPRTLFHCIDRIAEEVQQYLLDLDAVGDDLTAGRIDRIGDAQSPFLGANKCDCACFLDCLA